MEVAMATALEYGLVAAGLSVAIIATVNGLGTRVSKHVDAKPPALIVVSTIPVRPAVGPADLGVLLVPDLNHMDIWGSKTLAKN